MTNAKKVKLTGKKNSKKIYQHYSGHRNGLKELDAATVRARHPEQLIKLAVRGMLPKNTLARKAFSRLKVYAGADHPHGAQNPKEVDLG